MEYKVIIEQRHPVHYGTDAEYMSTDTIELVVNSTEKIESIIGLFGETCTITIKNNNTKEDN